MHYYHSHYESMATLGNLWKQLGPLPEQKKTLGNGKLFEGWSLRPNTQAEKREFEDSKLIVAAKSVKKQYTAKEKADYEKKKAGERRVKKEGWVALGGEFKNRVGAEAHKGVDHKVVDKRKSDNECMRCGMKNATWTYCQSRYKYWRYIKGKERPNHSPYSPRSDAPR